MSYDIVRLFKNGQKRTIYTRLTLEEAQAHCRDPESSSRTCTSSVGKARTRKCGDWFDSYSDR